MSEAAPESSHSAAPSNNVPGSSIELTEIHSDSGATPTAVPNDYDPERANAPDRRIIIEACIIYHGSRVKRNNPMT